MWPSGNWDYRVFPKKKTIPGTLHIWPTAKWLHSALLAKKRTLPLNFQADDSLQSFVLGWVCGRLLDHFGCGSKTSLGVWYSRLRATPDDRWAAPSIQQPQLFWSCVYKQLSTKGEEESRFFSLTSALRQSQLPHLCRVFSDCYTRHFIPSGVP